MQQPDGTVEHLLNKELLEKLSSGKEKLTGKPHPVFTIGEELEIKGGKWKVTHLIGNSMTLRAIPY